MMILKWVQNSLLITKSIKFASSKSDQTMIPGLKLELPLIKVDQIQHDTIRFQIISQNSFDMNSTQQIQKLVSLQKFVNPFVLSQFQNIDNLRNFLDDPNNYTFTHSSKTLDLKWSLKAFNLETQYTYSIVLEDQILNSDDQLRIANQLLLNQLKAQRKIIESQESLIAQLSQKKQAIIINDEQVPKKPVKVKRQQAAEGRKYSHSSRREKQLEDQHQFSNNTSKVSNSKRGLKTKKIKKEHQQSKRMDNSLKVTNVETLAKLRRQKELLQKQREKNKKNNPLVEEKLILMKDIYYQIRKKIQNTSKPQKYRHFQNLKLIKKDDLTRLKLSIHFVSMDGRMYVGQMKNDKENGLGVGGNGDDCYIGNWLDGKAHGKGKYQDPSGNQYIGDYIGDEKHGYGVDIFKNGDRYEGFFVNDERSGFGIYSFKNGQYFEGEWQHNKAEGPGIQFYRDGRYFEGFWKNDEKSGEGFLYDQDGNKTKQVWLDGVLEQEQQILRSDESHEEMEEEYN